MALAKQLLGHAVEGLWLSPPAQGALRGFHRDDLRRRVGGQRRRWASTTRSTILDSHLLVQLLPDLLARYDIDLELFVVPHPDQSADPHPQLRTPWAARDCRELARRFEVSIPEGPGQPGEAALKQATAILLQPRPLSERLEVARDRLGEALWSDDPARLSPWPPPGRR